MARLPKIVEISRSSVDPVLPSEQILEASAVGPPSSSLNHAPSPFRPLSPITFKLGLVLIVSLHVCIGLFMYGSAKLHHFVQETGNIATQIGYLGDDLLRFFPAVISLAWVSVAFHTGFILRILWLCIRYRRFALSHVSASAMLGPASHHTTSTPVPSWRQKLHTLRSRVLGRIPLETTEFELVVEIALQTFQANKLSQLVASVWINHLMAFVVIANCCFRPLIHLAIPRPQYDPRRELLCLSVDTVLDIVYCLVIPFTIFYPYWRDIQPPHYAFPFEFYYRDDWYIRAIAENRQLFVTSWLDFLSKSTAAIGLAFRLLYIQRLITLCCAPMQSSSVVPVRQSPVPPTPSSTRSLVHRRVFHALRIAWGLIVLGLHLHATTVAIHGADRGCRLELRPWVSTHGASSSD